MKNNSLSKRRKKRIQLVEIIYQYELLEKKIDTNIIFEEFNIDEFQLKIIKILEKNYENILKIMNKFIDQTWTWNRISPLTKAILLLGSSELFILEKKIVFNEYVEITKYYNPDDSYKFVNIMLEKVSLIYEAIKTK
ncbi:MAG: transcription antitermination protein NusB [Metamycoplasmataceae bacterium]